jgi:error-prone DNA polymerase
MNNFEFTEPGDPLPRRFAEIGWSTDQPLLQSFARLWHQIQDLPRHLGQHSGGMVICQNHLDEVVPIENASMPDRTVIQWDKDDCADMGIVKVDLLGLGMMAVLEEATELINRQKTATAERESLRSSARDSEDSVTARGGGAPREVKNGGAPREVKNAFQDASSQQDGDLFDIAHLPDNDPAVYELLRSADTIGVFQVESRAQMATLPRLSPREFYDLVVEVAIIRPGPIVGQMVHPYLNRRAGREEVVYPHPSLEPILNRTLGVPLFQEQLLRIAMVAAGFNGGQAEELRRAMGFKRSEQRMKKIEVQLRDGMARNGITGKAADQIVTSITSFALYGFPESHAISFALLAYASAYLKVHYPAVFYTALLNNQPMGFYHPSTLVKEAQRRGVRFAPIDIEHSDWLCTIEDSHGDSDMPRPRVYARGRGRPTVSVTASGGGAPRELNNDGRSDGGTVRLGLRYVNGLRAEIGQLIAAHERDARTGVRFQSIDDLTAHIPVRRDELHTLASIGALNTFGYDRRSALWQVERAIRPEGELFQGQRHAERESLRLSARQIESRRDSERGWGPASLKNADLPQLSSNADRDISPLDPMTLPERLHADYAGMGLTLGRHPMALQRDALNRRGILRACDLRHVPHGRLVRTAGAVITRQRPGTAKGFVFMTLEDETGLINVIIHPKLFARDWLTIIEQPFLYFEGVLQNVDNVINIRAERIASLDGMPELDLSSHDFH